MKDVIVIPKRSEEEREVFFKKNYWKIQSLLTPVDPYADTTPLEDASIVEVPIDSYQEDSEDQVNNSINTNEEE